VVERLQYSLRFADGTALELGRRTAVMGILNVTPDSFSDGGKFAHSDEAVEAGERMADEGADLIDVGGESTRPGAHPVAVEDEISRVVPVVEALRRRSNVRISIDTMKAEVARRALDAGADLINDVSALSDPEMASVLSERNSPAVLMHMRGGPISMQRDTRYADLSAEVTDFLSDRVNRALKAGLASDRIVVDPGIGFGKSPTGSLTLLRDLAVLLRIGYPVLIGASRKSFIGATTDLGVEDRLEASLAIAAFAASSGAHAVRVHDVGATRRAVDIIDALHQVNT
jgi:dihydropteroate synthase